MLSLARLGLEVLEFRKTTLDAMAGMYTVRGLNEYHILNMLILFPGIICAGDVWHHGITKSPDTVYLSQTHQQKSNDRKAHYFSYELVGLILFSRVDAPTFAIL